VRRLCDVNKGCSQTVTGVTVVKTKRFCMNYSFSESPLAMRCQKCIKVVLFCHFKMDSNDMRRFGQEQNRDMINQKAVNGS
jgi:uncharacterized CHY-type Zn-finger protein